MRNLVFCVVPNWNGKDVLGKCLDSLLTQTIKPIIVVVDNGSNDGSLKYVKDKYPGVKLVELDKNYGFSGGVNRGIEYALESGAEFVALLNNDATAEPNWLEKLVQTAKDNPNAGIVTGKIMRIDKKHLDSTGDFYSIWGLPFPRGRNEVDVGQYDAKTEVFGASGSGSLYRTKMLREVGLFDEEFFAYFEDVDISFRAQLAGWKVRYEPGAVVYHHVGATSSKLGNFARYHTYKNFVMLYSKNMPAKLFFKYLPALLVTSLGLLARGVLRGHLWTYIRGTCAGLKRLPGTFKKRRSVQRSRKVTVEYVDNTLWHGRPPRPPKLEEL